jgi:hypothetical protein
MKIDNVKVYDFAESIVASGLPMLEKYEADKFEDLSSDIDRYLNGEYIEDVPSAEKAIARIKKLSGNPSGSGHCNALSGILVSANVTGTNVWWLQMERYHFVQIVSMQSKMHCLRKMIDAGMLENIVNEKTYVNPAMYYDGIDDETLFYSCPMGLELTARIATNYLQLKTIYNQRKKHKLKEWRDFCRWIKTLPMSELIFNDNEEN